MENHFVEEEGDSEGRSVLGAPFQHKEIPIFPFSRKDDRNLEKMTSFGF